MHRIRPGIVGIVESKVKELKFDAIYANIFAGWKSYINNTYHPNGRVWVCWNQKEYDLQVLHCSAQMVHCAVISVQGYRFYLTFVYGFNKDHLRKPLREDLCSLVGSIQDAWCVLGDFNNVLNPDDRLGGAEVTAAEISDFKHCVETCGLQDAVATGHFYTRSNRQNAGDRIFSQIDRCLVNEDWMVKMTATVEFLPEGISDHSPILIKFDDYMHSKGVFRFCDMWVKHPQFGSLVAQAFQTQPQGCLMFKLVQRLKALLSPLFIGLISLTFILRLKC